MIDVGARAAALVGRPTADDGTDAAPAAAHRADGPGAGGPSDTAGARRSAAGLLHDLIVWGLGAGVAGDVLVPVERRLADLAGELVDDDPVLAVLVDWWLAVVTGLAPRRLWLEHPVPEALAAVLLPDGRLPAPGSATLTAARMRTLAKLAGTGDPILAGRLLAALGGPAPRPEASGLAVALAEAVDALGPDDRFAAWRLLGGLAEAVAAAAGDPQLSAFADEGARIVAEMSATLDGLELHAGAAAAAGAAAVRRHLEAGELAAARGALGQLTAGMVGVRARREAGRALDRARNRGVEGELVEALAAAVERDDVDAMTALANEVRVLPGMDRKVSELAAAGSGTAPDPTGVDGPGRVAGGLAMVSPAAGTSVRRGWPEGLERPPIVKATAAYVIRVNAHNRFFDGTICSAPAGNRLCASSERFKLDFCEKGVRRCSWLGAFAGQPRVELGDPFIEEYRPTLEAQPPEIGDVAVLWSASGGTNELVGLWRVLTLAPARRGWVLNGDRDAAVLLPRGIVPWSALYRRWSSPRGSLALRTLDTAGLEGLLVEVRDLLTPLAATDPGFQRDVAALEVMLADQRGRVPPAPRPALTPSPTEPQPEPARDGAGAGAAERARAGAAVGESPAAPGGDGAGETAVALAERLRRRGGFFPATLLAQYELATAEARLVILAGPSGTGKTRLALEFADETGAASRLVAVRPDWHANEDLLGYLPPFPGATFASTPAAQFILAAADEAAKAAADGRPPRPFHLCLDEMNLARPEHYLAEMLSKMEVPGGRISFHSATDAAAGFPAEVPYPPNLVVLGTVNLDETTIPLSAKILDRAAYLVVEAHELRAFLAADPGAGAVPAWVPRLLVDLDGNLDDAGQGLGYRIASRLMRWATLGPARGHPPEEALDWALAAQVVPRLRFSRSDPTHVEVLEAVIGRLRAAPGEFPRSVGLLERMLAELRRSDFTIGQMRLS